MIGRSHVITISERCRRRAAKAAEDGFNLDSKAFEEAAEEIDRLRMELQQAIQSLDELRQERSRIWSLLEEYRGANRDRAALIASSEPQ